MNAVVHGYATNVFVIMDYTVESGLVFSVADNGSGLPATAVVPASGSAIIDSWTARLDGTWSLTDSPERGAILHVLIPHP